MTRYRLQIAPFNGERQKAGLLITRLFKSLLLAAFVALLSACETLSLNPFFSPSGMEGQAGNIEEPELFGQLGQQTDKFLPIAVREESTLFPLSEEERSTAQSLVQGDFTQRLADLDVAIENYRQLLILLAKEESLSTALALGELYMRKADLLIAGSDDVLSEKGRKKDTTTQVQEALDDTIRHYEWVLATYFADQSLEAVAPISNQGRTTSHKYLAEARSHIYYQLAHAFALQQNLDRSIDYLTLLAKQHPDSDYYVESQFRRGENFFSLQDYASAASAFTEASTSKQHSLYEKSLYMHGWSAFKNGDFDSALAAMTTYLDTVADTFNFTFISAETESAERAVFTDAIRVMVYSFGYQEGVQSLTTHFQRYPGRTYEAAVYDHYIKMLEQQDRRSEAIVISNNFVETHPDSVHAPMFFARSIKLSQGQISKAAGMDQKAKFVALYGINGAYGMTAPATEHVVFPQISENGADKSVGASAEQLFNLEAVTATYLRELADDYYIAATKSKQGSGSKKGSVGKISSTADKEKTTELFLRAASYYEEYITTFPLNSDLYEVHYLLAESLFGAQLWRQAAVEYHHTAYDLLPNKYAADAGYAVIKAWENIVAEQDSSTLLADKTKLMEVEVRYVETFANEPKALLVAVNAMALGAQLEKDDRVVLLADFVLLQLAEGKSAVQSRGQLRQTVMINKTNALFRQRHFPAAEQSAKQTLLLINEKDPKRSEIESLLAAAIYKQTDSISDLSERKSTAFTVQRMLEIVDVAPQSSVAPVALYDAAAITLSQSEWVSSAQYFERFLKLYPNHDLAKEIPERLVYVYEQDGQLESSAKWLTVLAANALTEEDRARRLYRAATLYEKSGNQAKAIESYRDYAHKYPDPMGTVMLARQSLITIYGEMEEREKQQFWVSRVLADYSQRADYADELALQVVRGAALQQADWRYQQYHSTKLSFPLNRTIKQKKAALNAVVGAYETVVAVGDQAQVNQAVFRIGEIYQSLAHEIMTAETPSSLNDLEKAQYEILLEELAYPFEEQAIAVYEVNVNKIPQGVYDHWIKQSMKSLGKLMPARYQKVEQGGLYSDQVF